MSVAYSLQSDTVIAGVDWTAALTATLSWADGDATAKSTGVTALADATVDGSERLIVQIGAPTGGATLARSTSDVLIVDPAPVAVAVSPALHSGAHPSCGLGAATAAAIALGMALARRRSLGG